MGKWFNRYSNFGRMNSLLHYRTFEVNRVSPWVTVIHGAGGGSAVWDKQIREFRKEHNVLLLDLRGHGQSARGLWKKGHTFSEVAKEVIDVLVEIGVE